MLRGRWAVAGGGIAVAAAAFLALVPAGVGAPVAKPKPKPKPKCVAKHGDVVLRWSTESEIDVLGFDVYRGKIRLNCTLIPAKHPGELRGDNYVWKAQDGPGEFRLKIWDLHGSYTWYGEDGS